MVRHAQSCGQSTAVRTGVKAVQYAWVATLDTWVGFKPNIPLNVGVEKFVDWYKSFYQTAT